MKKPVKRYHEMRPDELAEAVRTTPVAYWPLGLMEHHGWHLPIGFDGLKAEQFCLRVAEKSGGVLLPTMWWGAEGGHGEFRWTHYQDRAAACGIVRTTTQQLLAFGFRVIVLFAGHYPWQGMLKEVVPPIEESHPDCLILWGTEMTIGGEAAKVRGDHAAREETSYGMALFPELVKLEALREGRGADEWVNGRAPLPENQHPRVSFDPSDPLFATMGEDARTASASHGMEGVEIVVEALSSRIHRFLNGVSE